MDSFFSLFDPADSEPRVKKEKRKNRRGESKKAASLCSHSPELDKDASTSDDNARQERVADESSFLCEPQLSRHVQDSAVSYLDEHMDLYGETASSVDPSQSKEIEKKKRSSGRRNRRKKKSPPKDLIPKQCWRPDKLFYPEIYHGDASAEQVAWNNTLGGWSAKASVGKNVNNLQDGAADDCTRKCKRRAEPFDPAQADGDLAACLTARPPTAAPVRECTPQHALQEACASEDEAPSPDDAPSDDEPESSDDSGDEVYGSLPPEPQLGNVEYKLQLVAPSDKKFQHLVTQLKWRLRSGGGSAVYVLGVRDCGALRGLRARALRASLRTLHKMAAALRAELRHVTSRQLAPHRAVAQVHVRKLADTQQSVELRVAVMGANEAGKSTLIGVLTQGELDNGRGSARLNMFRHLHEVQSGRTSSLSHEILGFDAQGNVVNYGCSELMTAERIGERSAKLVSFLDLAGHSKYQRTTVHGLTGYCPHYAALVVSATGGISRMTEEHLALIAALDLPLFVVLTRVDLATEPPHAILRRLRQLLAQHRRHAELKLITNEQQARCFASPAKTQILDQILPGACVNSNVVGVFPVSCVSGAGLNVLHAHLLALEPQRDDASPEQEPCEFQIDEIFRAGESGPVVGGLLASGVLREGDTLLIGPMDTGEFVPIGVKSVYRNRVAVGSARAGQPVSLGLSRRPAALRPGMVLIAAPPSCTLKSNLDSDNLTNISDDLEKVNKLDKLNANVDEDKSNLKALNINLNEKPNLKIDINNLKTGVKDVENKNINVDKTAPSDASDEIKSIMAKSMNKWDIKNFKRKEKNVLQDLANVQNCLVKKNDHEEGNLYRDECDKGGGLLMDDPDNPRGCLYFQATVRVLRHSSGEIYPGFQATVHIGNIRQTAVIQGIMSRDSSLAETESAPVVFRFVRQPEYVRAGRKLLFRAGRQTCGVGHVTQVFPMEPAT